MTTCDNKRTRVENVLLNVHIVNDNDNIYVARSVTLQPLADLHEAMQYIDGGTKMYLQVNPCHTDLREWFDEELMHYHEQNGSEGGSDNEDGYDDDNAAENNEGDNDDENVLKCIDVYEDIVEAIMGFHDDDTLDVDVIDTPTAVGCVEVSVGGFTEDDDLRRMIVNHVMEHM